MSKSLKKLIDINRLREFKNKLVGTGSAYVQTGAVDQTVAGTKAFSEPIVGSVTGSSGSCTGNAATATTATTAEACTGNAATATNATNSNAANQLQAFVNDNFTGGNHYVKAIRSSQGWSTHLWMCYNNGAKMADEVSVNYANSAGSANTANSATTATTAKACTGNAATATKATQDSDGNKITTTYSKNGHTHDDRYYTEAEVNNLLAGKANSSHTHPYIPTSASCNKNWHWQGQGGQPSWLWGGEDGTNMYVYNPSDFRVNYANSANSAVTAKYATLVRASDNQHTITFDWGSQVPNHVGITVDVTGIGGVVTTANLSELLGGIGVYDIGSTILALTGTRVDYGDIIAGSGLRYAALDRNGGIYNLDISIGATGAWVKVSGNSSETSGFGLYRRIS